MSRVGQSIINIPSGVEVKKVDNKFLVKGSKGELSAPLDNIVNVSINEKEIKVELKENDNKNKALWGTIRALINNCGERLDAPFDGEESITLYADLEAGISGSMSSALLPEKIAPVIDHFWNNKKDKAEQVYNNILPLINFENRQCGFRATKTVMKEGGVIKSDFCRDPIKPLDPDTKKLLLNFAKKYDLLTYKWGK